MRFFICSLIVSCLCIADAAAQSDADRRDRRRQFIEGLLQTIAQSQLEGQRPANGQAAAPALDARTLQAVRADLAEYSGEAARLVQFLRAEERYSSAMRPHLGEAIQLQATADLLARSAQRVGDPQGMVDDLRLLDSRWRKLEQGLRQQQNLSLGCRESIAKVAACNDRLCSRLNIKPQVDQQALLRTCHAIATNTANVEQDLEIDVIDQGVKGTLIPECQNIHRQFEHLATAVSLGAPYDQIARQYRTAYADWRKFCPQARPHASDSLRRNLRRLERQHDTMHQQLWLEQPLDAESAAFYAESFENDLQKLLSELPVGTVMVLPEPQQTLSSIVELHQLCESFGKRTRSDASQDDLTWDLRAIEMQWQDVQSRLQRLHDDQVRRRLVRLGQSADALREALRMPAEEVDDAAITVAAELDNLANQLDRELRGVYFGSQQYTSQRRAAGIGASRQFRTEVYRLRENVQSRSGQQQLKQELDDSVQRWRELVAELNRLSSQDRSRVAGTANEITPRLVKLQTMLVY